MSLRQRILARYAQDDEDRRTAKMKSPTLVESPVKEKPEDIKQIAPDRLQEPEQCATQSTNESPANLPQRLSRIVRLKIPGKILQSISHTCPRPGIQQATAATKVHVSGVVAKKRTRPESEISPAYDSCSNSKISGTNPPTKKVKIHPIQALIVVKSESNKENGLAPVTVSRSSTKDQRKQQDVIVVGRTPQWYAEVNTKQKASRGEVQNIAFVKTLIKNCIDKVNYREDTDDCFAALRDKLHKMEFYPALSDVLIKKSKILESEGLSQIFDGSHEQMFPWDIKSDAEALWRRWMDGDIDGNLMRGLEPTKSPTSRYRLKQDYNQKKKSSNAIGDNGLMNGQWWPNRVCAWRDGAHGSQQAGIHGQGGIGAFSIVVSGGYDDDKDYGEVLKYCGTRGKTSTPTRSTSLMLESFSNKTPVRVLRAAKKTRKYAPEEGIRYDGLYSITAEEILDPATAMFRFTLKRVKDQDPIRWRGIEKRPTNQEKKQRMMIRGLLR